MCHVRVVQRTLARRIARGLALDGVCFQGRNAADILEAASDSLTRQRRGLIFLHWPDADRAGHKHGWSSDAYAAAAAPRRCVRLTRKRHRHRPGSMHPDDHLR